MTAVTLTQNFLANARGFTFGDGGGIVWSFNASTNTLTGAVSGTGITPGSITNTDLANMASNTIKGNNGGSPAAPTDLTASQVKTVLSLNLVENTALSTWTGNTTVSSVGTINVGTWNGTAIGNSFIAAALSGKTYNGLTLTAQAVGFTIAGGTTSETLTVGANASVSGTNTGDQTLPAAANPSGLIGMSAVNGVAATFDRSDSRHAIDPAIAPTWTGQHIFTTDTLNKQASIARFASISTGSSAVTTSLRAYDGGALGLIGTESNHDLRIRTNDTDRIAITAAGVLSFAGTTSKPAITGSRGGNAALASLLTALATMGLITDSTTA